MQLQKAFTKLAMKLPAFVMLALFGLLSARAAQAAELTFSYDDLIGDQSGTIDVKKMTVVFDNTTGDYKIVLRATAAHPFAGNFRINVNLYNADAPPNASMIQDVFNDYQLASATTTLTLTGNSGNLLTWVAGHHVVTNHLTAYGKPAWVNYFLSTVENLPIAFPAQADVIAQATAGVAVVAQYTPQDAVELLAENVEALRDIGILTSVQAKYLNTPLSAAMTALNQGQTSTACASLQLFTGRVNEFKNQGVLTLQRAKPLVSAAAEIRTDLGC